MCVLKFCIPILVTVTLNNVNLVKKKKIWQKEPRQDLEYP